MIDKFENFILEYTEKNKYFKIYDDIISFLLINNHNLQNLLINKNLDFQKVIYYSKKKNKLLHEFKDSIEFTNFLIYILNHIYNHHPVTYDLTHNTLSSLSLKLININNELNENGVCVLPNILLNNKCKLILKQLNQKFFINRTQNIVKKLDLFDINNKNIWWIKDYHELFEIQTIQHIISSEYLLNIAENYLGCKPILHNVLFWASYPGDVETTQQFHQDYDDIKFLKVFIYLNDVGKENGPHTYVKKSLENIELIKKKLDKNESEKLSLRYSDKLIEDCYSKNIFNICGETGTIIFEDTHGLHKGTNVLKGKRFVLQLVYGVSTYYYLKNNNYEKYECHVKKHEILYQKFLKYPYSFMNFTFYQ